MVPNRYLKNQATKTEDVIQKFNSNGKTFFECNSKTIAFTNSIYFTIWIPDWSSIQIPTVFLMAKKNFK